MRDVRVFFSCWVTGLAVRNLEAVALGPTGCAVHFHVFNKITQHTRASVHETGQHMYEQWTLFMLSVGRGGAPPSQAFKKLLHGHHNH